MALVAHCIKMRSNYISQKTCITYLKHSTQDVMFDWAANLAGIEDRSECVMLSVQGVSQKSYNKKQQ